MEAAQALASAMKGGDEQKIQEAFVAFSTITEEGIRAEAAEAMSIENHDTTVLASRGVRMLTSAEIKAYTDLGNSVVAAAQSGAPTNWEVTLPETVIDAVMDDIRRAHPLLDEITFMNTHGAIKMLVNKKGAQTAVWGKITSAIAAELEGAFDAVDTMLLKLSAYMPISKDLVELGPTWMDAYVRATLSEAVALGLEVGIVDGDGKEKPIGMTRDVSDTANVQGGVYPRMTAVKLTSLEAEELGKIVAKLARDPLNKDDKHARPVNGLLLLVNSTAPGILIGNPGKQQSPCTIEIFGPAVNPKWTLIQKGAEIASGAVTAEIKEGQKLVVRSEADRLEIAIYTTENEWVEDVYQQSDFSTARFIYAPPGDSTLKFSHEGSQELNVSVEVRAYYEAV